ncbi:MerR family transcriptional regulator [Bacillus sp. JCM 19041]|uniref:MerR family transcriptional regulator n=1 Tax=Bacillus sp. JCM 19041 TaxID=1460637 RepID=UPI0009EA473E
MEPLKTKEVSKAIGVNPTTIQRWTKFFEIKCEVNEQGHFYIINVICLNLRIFIIN